MSHPKRSSPSLKLAYPRVASCASSSMAICSLLFWLFQSPPPVLTRALPWPLPRPASPYMFPLERPPVLPLNAGWPPMARVFGEGRSVRYFQNQALHGTRREPVLATKRLSPLAKRQTRAPRPRNKRAVARRVYDEGKGTSIRKAIRSFESPRLQKLGLFRDFRDCLPPLLSSPILASLRSQKPRLRNKHTHTSPLHDGLQHSTRGRNTRTHNTTRTQCYLSRCESVRHS